MLTTDSNRLTILETNYRHLSDDVKELSVQVGELSKSVNQLNTTLTVVIDQRDKADKALSRWKSAGLTAASALLVGLIIFLAKLAFIMQANHLAGS